MDGTFFRDRRIELDLTQDEIAAELDVTRTAVSYWDTGKSIPEWSNLDRVAKVYRVTVDRLMREMKKIADRRAMAAAK